MELLVVGKRITADLNLGLIKKSDEKTIEATAAISVAIMICLRFCQRNITRLVESNKLPDGEFSMYSAYWLGFIKGANVLLYSYFTMLLLSVLHDSKDRLHM